MFATFKLLNSHFWKTIYGPILCFLFPIALVGILGNVLKLEYVYPGIIALAMMFIGIIALPLAIMELKGSALFKYIGSTPVNPISFALVVIGFYALLSLIAVFLVFFATMAFFPSDVFSPEWANDGKSSQFKHGVLGGIFSWRGAFSFIVGFIIHLVFVMVSGIVIATFSSTPQQSLTIGIIIIIPSMFLSGMIISVDIISQNTAMQWISRFIPYRYSTGNLIIAASPLDQLESAVEYWQHQVDHNNANGKTVFDNIVWPFVEEYKPELVANAARLTLRPDADPTLFYLLRPHWEAMTLRSNNNIFDWISNWGVRKVSTAESLTSFVTKFLQGVDEYGYPLDPGQNAGELGTRVEFITSGIAKGDYAWMEIFTRESNTLYFVAEKVLNVLLPLTIAGLGLFYIVKRFNWSVR